MISVYLNLFNINLTAWFSAMILDDHAAKLATLSMMLPPTTLLGLDLPHHERNIFKKFVHSNDAGSNGRGRQLKSGSQDGDSAGMNKEPKALAESTTSGQGRRPEKPQVQRRALANKRASATVQAGNAEANLRFMSQCYPTPVLETIAIQSVIAHDLDGGLTSRHCTGQKSWHRSISLQVCTEVLEAPVS